MKTKILLLSIIIAGLSSCSTSYKTTQTPDDVYYSPVHPRTDYRTDSSNDDRSVYTNPNIYTDPNIYTSPNDYEIRHNRRWRNNRYNYPIYGDPKNPTTANPSTPRKYNLGVYKNDSTNSNPAGGKQFMNNNPSNNTNTTTAPVRTFGNPTNNTTPVNNGTGVGNFIRKVFTGGNNDNNNSNNNNNSQNNTNNSNSRTFETKSNNNTPAPSSSNSSSSGSSSSGSSSSAPVRVFK